MELGELIAAGLAAITGSHVAGHLGIRSQTIATSPRNRRRTVIGVGEEVDLTASRPTGTVNWAITGSSTLSATSGTTVTLTAHERAETTTVTATDSCGCTATRTFRVIEPASVRMRRVSGSGIRHTQGIPSVGIKLEIYIRPDTVSFENIEISEDDAIGVVTGYFIGTPSDGMHHAGHGAGAWASVGAHVSGRGSKVGGTDNVYTGHCNFGTPYRSGTFHWAIPWLFRVAGGASKQFTHVHHRETINRRGAMTITKGGARGRARLNAPTSTP
jgi:hypothetical protein